MANATVSKRPPPRESIGEASDVLVFELPRPRPANAVLKYLLANKFLRYAVRQPYRFVGRTEDDVLLNVSALGVRLTTYAHIPWLIFSPKGSWVMWDPATMMPVCWNAQTIAWSGKGDCRLTHDGPFLLFQGPLVVYSQALARELISLSRFSSDEARISGNWSGIIRTRMDTERTNHPEAPPRLGLVYSGVAEDVYYSGLLATSPAIANRNLTVISVPLSEYEWRHNAPVRRMRPAAVYHRLTTWQHLNASGLVDGLVVPPPRSKQRNRRSVGATVEAADSTMANLRPTPLLDQWWRQSSSDAACKRFGDKFSLFQPKKRRKRPLEHAERVMAGKFCCRDWWICD